MQSTLTTSWANYYKDRVQNEIYETYFATKYKPFLAALNSFEGVFVKEEGSGIGSVYKALRNHFEANFNLYGMYDLDKDMIELGRENCSMLKSDTNLYYTYPKPFNIIMGENNALPVYDVITSHGVLEHFSISDLKQIIRRQSLEAPIAVHYVPSNKYEKPSFGDELLLAPEVWEHLFKAYYKNVIVQTFNDGYDILIVAKNRRN